MQNRVDQPVWKAPLAFSLDITQQQARQRKEENYTPYHVLPYHIAATKVIPGTKPPFGERVLGHGRGRVGDEIWKQWQTYTLTLARRNQNEGAEDTDRVCYCKARQLTLSLVW